MADIPWTVFTPGYDYCAQEGLGGAGILDRSGREREETAADDHRCKTD